MKKFTVTFATVFSLMAFGLVSQAVDIDSSESTEESSELMVCVNWDTKEVRYSKYWENCPSKHATVNLGVEGPQGEVGPEGPRGPRGFSGSSGASGSTTSLWDSLSTCYQKLQSGMAAGLKMAAKSDRDFFESATGCTVENALDQTLINVYKRAGAPVIESIEFKSINSPDSGGDYRFAPFSGGLIFYEVEIANHLAISSLGSSYQYCAAPLSKFGGVEQIEGNRYRFQAQYRAQGEELVTKIILGYRENNYSTCFSAGLPEIVIQEDPTRLLGNPDFNDHLSAWGWQ